MSRVGMRPGHGNAHAMRHLALTWPTDRIFCLAFCLEHVLNDVHGICEVRQHETGKGEKVQTSQGFR